MKLESHQAVDQVKILLTVIPRIVRVAPVNRAPRVALGAHRHPPAGAALLALVAILGQPRLPCVVRVAPAVIHRRGSHANANAPSGERALEVRGPTATLPQKVEVHSASVDLSLPELG